MKNTLHILTVILTVFALSAVCAPPVSLAQSRNVIMELPNTDAAVVTVTAPIAKFDPEYAADDQPDAVPNDTLRGPLSTVAIDTTIWIRMPSTLLTWAADTVKTFCVWFGGTRLDTVSASVGIQFGRDGIPDTTAATTKIFLNADGVTAEAVGPAIGKASATAGIFVSRCASFPLLAAFRGNNCFRLIVSHQKANNASAEKSLVNSGEKYSTGIEYLQRPH